MENDILDALEDIGYEDVLDEEAFEKAIVLGPKSYVYTKLIEVVTTELCNLCDIDEKVSAVADGSDPSAFLMELSGFLREYGCPYKCLCEGEMDERLATRNKCLQLLDYLLTELMSVRILSVDRPCVLSSTSETVNQQEENEMPVYMKKMLIALGFPKPPVNITEFQLFLKVEAKVKELLTTHTDRISKPLLKARLSEKQWSHIEAMNDSLTDEYNLRRDMLLKRLDVTIQSFKWSERAKAKENDVARVYQPIRGLLSSKQSIDMHDLLASREDLTAVQKITTGDVRKHTKCAINKVLMGKVPDRGGRAHELQPPPPEMPSFMKRQAGPPPQQQRPQTSYGGRGGRGGRVQGGWSGGDNRAQSAGGWSNQEGFRGGRGGRGGGRGNRGRRY